MHVLDMWCSQVLRACTYRPADPHTYLPTYPTACLPGCPSLLSQYLDGPEVDCDLVMSEGAPVFGAITDNWPTVEPYFNETGSNCPSILPRECMDAMAWLMPAWQFGKSLLCDSPNAGLKQKCAT
jgi:hypothetical protein